MSLTRPPPSRHPVVSMGVLRWVEFTLTDPTFFEVAAESSALFLVLLDEVGHVTVTCLLSDPEFPSLNPDCSLPQVAAPLHIGAPQETN